MHEDMSETELRTLFTESYWDERYGGPDRIWSGRPNARLVEHVTGMTPGTALDVGCGEGGDVVWLAQQGWTVTGSDVSGVALEHARRHAEDAGVGDRTSWVRADVLGGPDAALPSGFDLVTSHFLHAPPGELGTVIDALAAAVAPGGTLLVVGHHADDQHVGIRNPALSSMLLTPEVIAARLAAGEWEVRVSDSPTRTQVHHGEEMTVTDAVVLAVRSGSAT